MNSLIYAIDPGTTQSGYVVFDCGSIVEHGVLPNDDVLRWLDSDDVMQHSMMRGGRLAIEMMRARGMPVSNDEMKTLVWIGRFQQQWYSPDEVLLVYRQDVKLHICGSMKAKDPNIRAALLDLIGPQGTKREPGPTYGVKSHEWAALAVAVTARDQLAGAPA